MRCVLLCAWLIAAALSATGCVATNQGSPSVMHVFFGSSTKDQPQTIRHGLLNMATGALTIDGGVGDLPNPSFLTLHPSGRYLYSVAEVGEFEGQPGGAVAAYAIDRATGALTLLNTQSTVGPGPCHVVLNPAGTVAVVSNWAGGSIASYKVQPDGTLGPAVTFIQYQAPPDAPPKTVPRAHSATFDPAGRFVVIADMGLDCLHVYAVDSGTAALTYHRTLAFPPHTGPRHFAFHPGAPFAYVINEFASTVTVLKWDAADGALSPVQTVSTLPIGWADRNSCAEVVVHPNGRFLYGSNRGHDSIAIFRIDPRTGELTSLGYQSTGGRTPRNFAVDPTGRWLVAANQNSDNAQAFAIDQTAGTLTPVGEPIAIARPTCVRFLPAAE